MDGSAPSDAGRRRPRRLWLVRLLLRLAPAERRRLFFVTLAVGGLGGLAAVAFHLALRFAETHLIGRALATPGSTGVALVLLVPTLGGLVCGILLVYAFPDARGSGVPQVKVAHAVRGGRIPFRITIGKFIVSTLQIGSGSALGREGPTVQICAGIASLLGRAGALSRRSLASLMPVGAAAGIAAAFNAPIAAVTFAIEEIIGDLDHAILIGIIVTAAIAAVVERAVLGTHPAFELHATFAAQDPGSLVLYAALGVAAAVVSVAFVDLLLGVRARFQRRSAVPTWARPAFGGLVTGTLAVVALKGLGLGGIAGIGYDTLTRALEGRLALQALLALCVLKLIATAFSYGSGGAGGIFAPALFMGGMLGGAMGYVDVTALGHDHAQTAAFALVGMGAVFAGVVRAPITSVLIIFEMTDGYGLILPLMIANMTAYGLSRRWRPTPVYDALLEQDGIQLPGRGTGYGAAIGRIRVRDAMTRDPVAFQAGQTVDEALERIEGLDVSAFPVVDAEDGYLGMVGEARLRRTAAREEEARTVDALADPGSTVHPDDPLVRAVVLMHRQDVRQIAVVERGPGRRLVGILTMGDVVRAEADAAVKVDRSLAPDFGEAREVVERREPPREPG